MSQEISLEDWLDHSPRAVGIVFTDIVGSTILIHRLETTNFSLILRAYQARALELAARFGGRVVDKVGDELFAAFRTAADAYRFASALYQDAGHPQLSVRAGVHFGTVQADEGRLVGRNVHLGARIMEHGGDHELWLSDAAKRALESESEAFASAITWLASVDCQLKGIPDTHRLWRAA
jgi:class 3 adenylate cyclase